MARPKKNFTVKVENEKPIEKPVNVTFERPAPEAPELRTTVIEAKQKTVKVRIRRGLYHRYQLSGVVGEIREFPYDLAKQIIDNEDGEAVL